MESCNLDRNPHFYRNVLQFAPQFSTFLPQFSTFLPQFSTMLRKNLHKVLTHFELHVNSTGQLESHFVQTSTNFLQIPHFSRNFPHFAETIPQIPTIYGYL